MTKPYIIVHMMTSIDGRIDCGMTVQLDGKIGRASCRERV